MEMRRRVGVIAVLAAVAACAGESDRPGAEPGGLRGAVIEPPRDKPDFTLADMHGSTFEFRRETDGYATLVFFGYTYCPDICPAHMANLGSVLRTLPLSVTTRVRLVFITTDPARDTPERLREWLGNFHTDFIGLTGSLEEVNRIQQSMGLPPAVIGPEDERGNYDVGHWAAVIAFTPDDLLRVMYPSGMRQMDWAHDLPRLVGSEWPLGI